MTTDILKFFHLILVMSTGGLLIASYSLVLFCSQRQLMSIVRLSYRLDAASLFFLLVLALTGFFLVHPKGFDFTTPWIEVAFILTAIVFIGVLTGMITKRRLLHRFETDASVTNLPLWFHVANICMFIILLLIIHDAVTKTTFFIR